jgi:integrase
MFDQTISESKKVFFAPKTILSPIIKQFWNDSLESAASEEARDHTQSSLDSFILDLESKQNSGADKTNVTNLLMFLFKPDCDLDTQKLYTEEIEILSETIEKRLGKAEINLAQLSTISELYNAIAEYGNTEQLWKLPYIREIHKLKRIKNPISEPTQWQRYLYIETLHQQYQQAVTFSEFEPKNLTHQEQIALLLVSLLFDSAILHSKNLTSVLQRLQDTESYQYFHQRLFFEVITHPKNPAKKVFLSPQTELLIYRIKPWELTPFAKKDATLHKDIVEALRAILKKLSLKVSVYPTSLYGWCQWLSLYQTKFMSPILIASNQGKHINHSLNGSASLRLLRTISSTNTAMAISSTQDIEHSSKQSRPRSHAFSEIRKIFDTDVTSQPNHEKISMQIIEQAKTLSPKLSDNYSLILEWGLSYIELTPSRQFKKNPKQILKKISTIGRHLIAIADDVFLQKVQVDERIHIYREVINQAVSIQNKNEIQYDLRDFNSWLEKSYDLEKIKDKENLFGSASRTDITVNANLIHFDEYGSIKNSLQSLIENYPEDNSYKIMLGIFILGFKLGLRITEAVELKFIDYLYCDKTPQILIRESEGRKTKSRNAKRAQKLTDLLSHDEIEFFNQYHHSQLKRFGRFHNEKEHYYFFSTSRSGTKLKSVEVLKKRLMKLIRETTQDSSLKFHHLRHSFASWHFFSAAIAELDLDIGSYFKHLPQTELWLKNADVRKLEHLPTQLKSKKYPYWLVQRIGHGSIETTLEHYIHTIDLINMLYQDSVASCLTINDLHGLSAIPVSTLKKHNHRIGFALNRLIKQTPNLKIKQATNMNSLKPEWLAPSGIENSIELLSANIPFYEYMDFLYQINENPSARHKEFRGDTAKKLTQFFKENPAYRISELRPKEVLLLMEHLDRICDLFDYEPVTETDFPQSLQALLDTFSSRIHPYSADTESLDIQKRIHLIFNDVTSGKRLIEFTQQMKIPVKIIFRHSSLITKEEIETAKKYWIKQLELKAKTPFSSQTDTQSKLGKHGRIELVFTKQNGKPDHSVYFLLVMLCVVYFAPIKKLS